MREQKCYNRLNSWLLLLLRKDYISPQARRNGCIGLGAGENHNRYSEVCCQEAVIALSFLGSRMISFAVVPIFSDPASVSTAPTAMLKSRARLALFSFFFLQQLKSFGY